ncbi:MAG: metallophosphoesterase [Actinomycetota bacterium]|nr:metallophosphoesterase [Actinomycetota bacterium]
MAARAVRGLLVAVVALGAGTTAMASWAGVTQDVGPVDARLRLTPSVSGGVRVEVPPLGRLDLATHAGPLQVRVRVTGVRPDEARVLLRSSDPGRAIGSSVAADSREGLRHVVATGVLVALLAAGATCAVVFRRVREVVVGTTVVAAALASSGVAAVLTLTPRAVSEPRFTGLLAQAPVLVGRVEAFDAYSQRIAELTASVSRVYTAVGSLPVAPPAEDSVRVLWMSDVHNNPESFRLARELVQQFGVQAVVDTGDLTDLGSVAENRLLTPIGRLGVPYLYVRGNHDSFLTQAAVDRFPNAVVLDRSTVVEVAGLRWAGTGDPLYTPNREVDVEVQAAQAQQLEAAGEQLAAAVERSERPVQIALVHDPRMAVPLFGTVPLVLDGHVHERRSRTGDGTLELTQGSSGGAGLRTLEDAEPLPLQMSVLHLSRTDGALLAVDDVTVGGVGRRSVQVERRTPESYVEEADELDDEDEDEDEDEVEVEPEPSDGVPSVTPSP